jgi:hypothetical protein
MDINPEDINMSEMIQKILDNQNMSMEDMNDIDLEEIKREVITDFNNNGKIPRTLPGTPYINPKRTEKKKLKQLKRKQKLTKLLKKKKHVKKKKKKHKN